MIASFLVFAAALALQAADSAQSIQPLTGTPSQTMSTPSSQVVSTPSGEAVSVDRIRQALARPVHLNLTVQLPEPDFRVEIQQRRSFPDLPPWNFSSGPTPAPWAGPSTGFTTPALFNLDLLSLGRSVGNAIHSAERDRATREAQQEVQEELRVFCATHDCTPR
jgi:hypothetical protein